MWLLGVVIKVRLWLLRLSRTFLFLSHEICVFERFVFMELKAEMMKYVLESAVFLYIAKASVEEFRAYLKRRRNKQPFKKAFLDIAKIYELLNMLMVDTMAHRVIIYRSHNGGGKPKLGKPLYCTAQYEVYHSSRSKKAHWNCQELDSGYVNLLSKLDQQSAIDLFLETMPDGILKADYFGDNVTSAVVFKIHETPSNFYFLEIRHQSKTDISGPVYKNVCRPYINSVKVLFSHSDD